MKFYLKSLLVGIVLHGFAVMAEVGDSKSVLLAKIDVTTLEDQNSVGTSTLNLQPQDLFESDNKSELFLSATKANLNSGVAGSSLSLGGLYSYLIKPQMQLGVELSLFRSANAQGSSLLGVELYALGLYNFDENIAQSSFLLGGVGFLSGSGSTGSKMGLKLGGGQRFPVFQHIQFVPTAWVEKREDSNPTVHLMPVNFSVIF